MSPRKTKDNPLGLEPFEGDPVTEIGMEIPGAGGGFQQSLDVDVTLLDMLKGAQKGDTIFAVFQLVKKKVHMDPAKSHEGWRRVDIWGVDGVGIIDADMAMASIQEQRDRVQAAIDKANGVAPMFDKDGNPVEPDGSDDPDETKESGAE